MLKTLPQKLLLISLSFVFLFSLAVLLTLTTKYKPWGVPDVRRAEYESKIMEIKIRNAKIDQYQNKPRPQRYVRNRIHDFGFVAVGESLSKSFKIKNVGLEPLSILSASIPDNVELEIQEELVPPGEATDLVLTWRPSSADLETMEGQAEDSAPGKTIEITTNDPVDPSFTLSINAKPKEMFLYPKQLVFDPCSVGESIGHSFYLASQSLSHFKINSIDCDAAGFFVDHEPVSDLSEVGRDGVTAAHRIFVRSTPMEYGAFKTPVNIQLTANNSAHELIVELVGRTKSPITFYHPEMHRTKGLDLGTLSAEQEHQFHVQVRLRGEEHRTLELLDLKPNELEGKMTPQKSKGVFKLTITVPKNCPTILFNRGDQRGFVKVGDPADPNFYHWFPIYGAVANVQQ